MPNDDAGPWKTITVNGQKMKVRVVRKRKRNNPAQRTDNAQTNG
jgi:hypothetical protein